jgi:hypothetical protein
MTFSNEEKSKCTWDINVRENKGKIEDLTIERQRQHKHKTQNEDKQVKLQNQ